MLPSLESSLKQSVAGCQVHSSPLVEEALNLGFVIKSIVANSDYSTPPYGLPLALRDLQVAGPMRKIPLPAGHRFYYDCLREQEARLLDWLLHVYQGSTWFFTQTFKDWVCVGRAERLQARFMSRLNQAYKDTNSRAALLKSVSVTEWQQRDVVHYHLLILGIGLEALSRKRFEHRWRRVSGGFAACYDAEVKAADYLVKHQTRKRDGNLHLGGSWRDISPPRSLERCCSASNGFASYALQPLAMSTRRGSQRSSCFA
jgi:hypothetical protein